MAIVLLMGCSRTFYVPDTKFFQEQYLYVGDFTTTDIACLESKFHAAGFAVHFEYVFMEDVEAYMILSPAMIEYTNKRGKGILKKRHVKRLKNTL
jgi:hypothetical protein